MTLGYMLHLGLVLKVLPILVSFFPFFNLSIKKIKPTSKMFHLSQKSHGRIVVESSTFQ